MLASRDICRVENQSDYIRRCKDGGQSEKRGQLGFDKY
jgi:hypothetical protein